MNQLEKKHQKKKRTDRIWLHVQNFKQGSGALGWREPHRIKQWGCSSSTATDWVVIPPAERFYFLLRHWETVKVQAEASGRQSGLCSVQENGECSVDGSAEPKWPSSSSMMGSVLILITFTLDQRLPVGPLCPNLFSDKGIWLWEALKTLQKVEAGALVV